MVTTFETAQVGDKVWDMRLGWGRVHHMREMHNVYPVDVLFPKEGRLFYTVDGLYHKNDINQSLFWDEVKIDPPSKSLPNLEVDAKVLVWTDPSKKHRRHFSHFYDGAICTFDSGATSFSMLDGYSITSWPHWEIVE